jgi:hypothetical protein
LLSCALGFTETPKMDKKKGAPIFLSFHRPLCTQTRTHKRPVAPEQHRRHLHTFFHPFPTTRKRRRFFST